MLYMSKTVTVTAKKKALREEIMKQVMEDLATSSIGQVYDMDKEILIRCKEFDAVVRVVIKKDRVEFEEEGEE